MRGSAREAGARASCDWQRASSATGGGSDERVPVAGGTRPSCDVSKKSSEKSGVWSPLVAAELSSASSSVANGMSWCAIAD